jgi:hypothetical protein
MKRLLLLSATLFFSTSAWAAAEPEQPVTKILCGKEPVTIVWAGGLILEPGFVPVGMTQDEAFFTGSDQKGYRLHTARAEKKINFTPMVGIGYNRNDIWRRQESDGYSIFYLEQDESKN